MKVEIRHPSSYAVARCFIQPGEVIQVESGAMYAQSLGMRITSEMQGGLFGAMKRSLMGGDSFFVSKFSAPGGGWVDVVPTYPGDIFNVTVSPGSGLILTQGAWLASDIGVKLDTKFGGAKMLIGGEGLFTVKCTGQGEVVGAAYGSIDHIQLQEGEGVTVDTGHLVAYEDGMQVNIRQAGTGILNSLKSGEGLVMDFMGPGDLITQTRNPQGLASFIQSLLPKQSNSN